MVAALSWGRRPRGRPQPQPKVPTVSQEVDEVFARLMEIADAIEKRAWKANGD